MATTAVPVDVNKLDTSQVNTFREFLGNFNRVAERCFRSCVWDFSSRNIKSQENRCVEACVEKFLKSNQRISERFQEIQVQNNEHLIQQQQAIQFPN